MWYERSAYSIFATTFCFPSASSPPSTQEYARSDGGTVLLKAAERVYGLVKAFARRLTDKRAPGKIRHTFADLIGQRIFGIAIPMATMPTTLAEDHIAAKWFGVTSVTSRKARWPAASPVRHAIPRSDDSPSK